MICETCSCEMLDDAILRIHDERKWLTSPHPCPDCMERGLESMRQAGERLAQKLNAAAIEALGGESGRMDGQATERRCLRCGKPIDVDDIFANVNNPGSTKLCRACNPSTKPSTDPVEYVGTIIACDRRLAGDAAYKEYLERLLLAIVENVSDGVMFEARFNERTMRLEIVTTKDAAEGVA